MASTLRKHTPLGPKYVRKRDGAIVSQGWVLCSGHNNDCPSRPCRYLAPDQSC